MIEKNGVLEGKILEMEMRLTQSEKLRENQEDKFKLKEQHLA